MPPLTPNPAQVERHSHVLVLESSLQVAARAQLRHAGTADTIRSGAELRCDRYMVLEDSLSAMSSSSRPRSTGRHLPHGHVTSCVEPKDRVRVNVPRGEQAQLFSLGFGLPGLSDLFFQCDPALPARRATLLALRPCGECTAQLAHALGAEAAAGAGQLGAARLASQRVS